MPKFNLRFALVLVATIAVLGVGVYFLHAFQTRRHAGFFLAQAQTALEDGDRSEAVAQYYNYLSLNPKDDDARAELGFLLADGGANQAAYLELENVLRSDPQRSDVRRRTVKAAMALGRFRDAREHLEQYLLQETPDDAELLDLVARCQVEMGEYPAAARSLERAVQQDPQRVGAFVLLAAILSDHADDLAKDAAHWKGKSADYWLDRLVKSNPALPSAYLIRGQFRFHKKERDLAGAKQDAQRALELKANDPAALALAANACLDMRAAAQDEAAKGALLSEARSFAQRGVKAAPKDPRMYATLANIELADSHRDKAIEWLRNGVAATDHPEDLLWQLGRLLIATGNFTEAGNTIAALRKAALPKKESAEVLADFLEAQIDYAQGHWLAASQRFDRLGSSVKRFPALAEEAFYCLGRSYELLGDAENALAAYRQAVGVAPSSVQAREAIAASLASLGRLDEALEEQRTVVKLQGASRAAGTQLLRWSIRKNLRLGAAQRDWSEAQGLLDQLAKAAPKSALTPLLRAELLVAQDRAAEAEKLIQARCDQEPGEIAFWIALVDLALREKQWDRAEQVLQGAEKKLGDRVPLRLARAYYLARRGEKNAAEQLGPLAEKAKDFSREDLSRLWRGLADASLQVGDFRQAAQLLQRVMAQEPNDLQVRMQLFEVAAQAGDFPLMEKVLEEIRLLDGNGALSHYATAVRLSLSEKQGKDQGKPGQEGLAAQRQAALQQALEHLAAARRSRPGWSRALMLEGLIYEELRQEGPALAKYLQAVEQGDNSPDLVRRALQLLYRKGQYAAANTLLRRLEEQQVPFTTDLFRVQSSVLERLQDFPGALKAAQQVAAASKDYRDHLWLGQVLSILGRRDEAEKALRSALSLDEQAPETWVALVQFLVRTEQKGPAEATLAQAKAKLPADKAALALAECYEALGKPDEAGQQYAAALKGHPDDPALVRRVAIYHVGKGDLPEAARLFKRIVDGQLPGTSEQVAAARGALARVLADQGGYPNFVEAVRLVDQSLAAAPSSADDLRLKARLLVRFPQRAKRQEALAIFEKLVEDPKNTVPEDHFTLAQLYLAGGDWPKARKELITLAAKHGDQPQYLAAYTQALLDHNEFREAEPWLDRLEQIAPGDPRAAQLRAEVQFRAGKIDDVLATLNKFVAQDPAEPSKTQDPRPKPQGPDKAAAASANRLARMLEAAGQLETMGSRPGSTAGTPAAVTAKEKAEVLYRKYVKEKPEHGLVLVEFLARQKRLDEALKAAEEAWKAADRAMVARGMEVLMNQPGVTPAELDRIANILTAAIQKHDRAAPLLLVMALVRTRQEKFAEVEALYRELLQKDARYVPALNNLAELLALGGRQLDEALGLVEKAVALEGPNSVLLDTRGSVYLALGKPKEALADLTEAAAQTPRASVYFHIAQAHRRAGDLEAAAAALKQARKLELRPEALHPLERQAYADLARSLP